MDDVALAGLSARCFKTCDLNLSWTGGGGQVTESCLCRYNKLPIFHGTEYS